MKMLQDRIYIPIFMLVCIIALMFGIIPMIGLYIPLTDFNVPMVIYLNLMGWTILCIISCIKIVNLIRTVI